MQYQKLKFGSKAETLNNLNLVLKKKILIPKFLFYKKKLFKKNQEKILELIEKKFKNKKIIIRSSGKDEDKINNSLAGKYDSIIVKNISKKNLIISINKIFKKLKKNDDQIIFQEFIHKTDISGVLFTADINNNSPYFIINYDTSGKTSLVTSGQKNISEKTLIIYRGYKKIPKKFIKLIKIVNKLMNELTNKRLDIEFAIKKKKVYIFQVRQLKKVKKINNIKFNSALINIEKKIKKYQYKNFTLHGNSTIFSNMADWNPAEMIGAKSKKLSISLYEELITNDVWSTQRNNYFYKDVRPNRLLIDLAGSPYIDLRVDLNSFLPKGLPKNISEKLINFFINTIKKQPHLHDKIEFKLIPTSRKISDNYKNFKNFLNKNEIKTYEKHLIYLTNNILSNKQSPFLDDLNKINKLEKLIFDYKINKKNPIQDIFYLIDTCKKLGTLPFSGIARTAFISTELLLDLKDKKLLSDDNLSYFYKSSQSVSKKINNALIKAIKNSYYKKIFIKKYGHLRPSTYSISSKNYKEGFDIYFKNEKIRKDLTSNEKFSTTKNQRNKINHILKKSNINLNFYKLINIAKKSIFMREYSKLIFSKCIDLIFNNLIVLGKEINIDRKDWEYISINSILDAQNNLGADKFKYKLKKEILNNKKLFQISKLIKLPEVITSPNEVYCFHEINNIGNFITNKSIFGKTINLDTLDPKEYRNKLIGKIVFIENADPGYDFIFSYNIKGLVTKYGGVNSHMSIRCSEMEIPAVIGIGEKKYDYYLNSKSIEMVCQNKIINKI
ncbi:PEP-utilizing enzyme [Candidatus Pelagibacter sp.]|nr:PEP-utilizing enzyme [Candidatus Pelagibacter sp.]